jgi:predicted nucleotidyltransferase
MRLTVKEKSLITQTFQNIFKQGSLYLFGSRVDDTKRGGDIDLFIDIPYQLDIKEELEKKSQFRLKLYEMIGEQKIDIIVSKDKSRSIEKEILRTGILL